MSGIHIIALVILAVLLVAIFFVVKVHEKEMVLTTEDDMITSVLKKLEAHIHKLNVEFKVKWYLLFLATAPVVLGIILFLFSKSGPMAVLIGCLGFLVPEGIVQLLKMGNDKKFEERYARALEQLSSSLRAGLSITQAVEDTANCKFLHETMRKRFAKMSSELQMGLTISEAFRRFADSTNNEDANDIAIAIDVQNEVGGHEAEVIKEIADDIKDRMMLRREVKSMFSSTSSMVWIMDFFCPLIIIGFSIMRPDFLTVYFSSPLYTILFVAIIVMIVTGTIINHHTLAKVKKGA